MPYAPDLALPEEDSVALGRKRGAGFLVRSRCLTVGVVRLPHISNYTDFDPLEQEPGVSLRYLDHRPRLAGAGPAHPARDQEHHQRPPLSQGDRPVSADSGLRPGGGHLVGICGGYQLLGQEIRDPLGVEGPPGRRRAWGCCP